MQSYASLRKRIRRLPVAAEGRLPADIQRHQREGRARLLQQHRGLGHRHRQGVQRRQEGRQDHPRTHLVQPRPGCRLLQDRVHAVPRGRRSRHRVLVHRHHPHRPHDGRDPRGRHDRPLRVRDLGQAGNGRRLQRAGGIHAHNRGRRKGAGGDNPEAQGMPRRGEHPDKASEKN